MSAFYRFYGLGLCVNAVLGFLLRYVFDGINSTPPDNCSAGFNHRPCEETAMLWFTCFFYFLYDVKKLKNRRVTTLPVYMLPRWIALLAYAVIGSWIQVYLSVFDFIRVLWGGLIGTFVCLLFSAVCYDGPLDRVFASLGKDLSAKLLFVDRASIENLFADTIIHYETPTVARVFTQ